MRRIGYDQRVVPDLERLDKKLDGLDEPGHSRCVSQIAPAHAFVAGFFGAK